VHLADLVLEHHHVEFPDHLARGKFAQVAAVPSGGALRMFLCHVGEISAFFNLLLEFFAFLFGPDEDVSRFGFGHDDDPFFDYVIDPTQTMPTHW
jgi:hypothetical protein